MTLCIAVMALVPLGCGKDSTTASTTSTMVTTTTERPRPASAELRAITEMDEGDCFDVHSEASSLVRAVWLMPCPEAHRYEVYAAFDYEGDVEYRHPAYPGEIVVQDQAERRCYERFEPFTGIRWTISLLDIRTWWPSETSWKDGDRRIICAVTSTDRTPLTGSQEGSRR